MIDSHCHLADDAFSADRDAVIDRAREALTGALCIVDAGSAQERAWAAEVSARWPAVRFAVGVHPHRADNFKARLGEVAAVVGAAADALPATRAIGEIGLDYHYDYSPVDVQTEVFRALARLAADRGLPVVIHARDAEDDALELLLEVGHGKLTGVFHCYTGPADAARRVVQHGFYVGFGGVVTFPRAHDIRAIARTVPLERTLIETDSPYLAPVPHRGKRNEPAWVAHVAEALAVVHGLPVAAIVERTTANYEALFRP